MPFSTASRRAGLVALAIVALHFASFDLRGQPIVTDVRYFLYYAWQVSEGAVPHLDFFENKPQLSVFLGAGLYQLGALAGTDPLIAIRAGQLALAALASLLSFVVFRRLGGVASGFVGLAAVLSFGLLGALPAVGALPKLAMVVLATASALLVHDRRWLWAGLAGGLAFFDWQIGGAAWLAAAVAAGVGEGWRSRALLRVSLGGALAVAPFAVYYTARGALAAAFDQVIVATFFRGASALGAKTIGERAMRIAELVREGCPEHAWLFYLSAAGVPVAVWWLTVGRRREGGEDRVRLLLPLCVFHGVLLSMSAIETQGYGDLFALLHVAAFGLGLAGWTLIEWVRRRAGTAAPWAPGLIALLALLLARPGPLRPALELDSVAIRPGATLADQREVARAAEERIGEASFGLFDSSELLFLMRRENALPSLYWNRATRAHFRSPSDATPTDTVVRLLEAVDPAFFVAPRRVADRERVLRGSSPLALRSRSGRYAVELRVR
ncbi:MAG: hypothetical protein VX681_03990 [Myxococcota bacterium]|nr:hypothetical protein [Myxococcota bacterium]